MKSCLLKKRKGQDVAEWALLVALISVIAMATMFAFAPKMVNILDYINHSINQVQQQ